MPVTALLLIAHGSRNPQANADLYRVADDLRRRGFPVVEPAFLELAEPGIDQAAERCVVQQPDQVILVPYFLSAGVHVLRDLTGARDRLGQRFPTIRFSLAEPLGCHPLLLEVVAERVAQALLTSENPAK